LLAESCSEWRAQLTPFRFGLAAQQDCSVCPGYLGYLFVDLSQRIGIPDEMTEIIALAQLLLEMDVLVDQALLSVSIK